MGTKVSEMDDILSTHTLDGNDLFYVADNLSSDVYKSRKIKYSDLLDDIALSIGGGTPFDCIRRSEVVGKLALSSVQDIVGNGLTVENGKIATSSYYTTFEYVKNNLSSNGYCAIFRIWNNTIDDAETIN